MNLAYRRIGSQNGAAKLTPEAVREIRSSYRRRSREYGGNALAKRFGVSYYAIWCVVHHQTWPEAALKNMNRKPEKSS